MNELITICSGCKYFFRNWKRKKFALDGCFIYHKHTIDLFDSFSKDVFKNLSIIGKLEIRSNELIEIYDRPAPKDEPKLEPEYQEFHVCYVKTDSFTPVECPFKFEREMING